MTAETEDLAQGDKFDNPLSSMEIGTIRASGARGMLGSAATRPLVLRALHPAPNRELPEHRYDQLLQIATDLGGHPLGPSLRKEWTTLPTTHTDGDGGDNEMWDWEEIK